MTNNPYTRDSDAADKEWLHNTFFNAEWSDAYYDDYEEGDAITDEELEEWLTPVKDDHEKENN